MGKKEEWIYKAFAIFAIYLIQASLISVSAIAQDEEIDYNVFSSNVVYLNVGVDDEPPQWSSLSKSKTTIYQNSYVNFTTNWSDNVGLRSLGSGSGSVMCFASIFIIVRALKGTDPVAR